MSGRERWGSGEGGDDAVVGEELGEPLDQRQPGDLVEVDPPGLGGVVARDRLDQVDHRHLEVEDDVVTLAVDALGPAEQRSAEALAARLLPQLARDRLGEGRARSEEPTTEPPTLTT